ncbi:MAG TPA: ATP-binding protein, partial [Burkholderiaceae bacterium]
LQQLALLALVAAFILLGLRRGLRPVLRLRDAVIGRPAGATEPLAHEAVPTEFLPLVEAINAYARRLVQYTESQRVFVQNAAHQLRTPFTLLQTQTSFALRARDEAARHESLVAMRRTVHQAVRLVNQLLVLSAAEAHAEAERRPDVVELRPLLQRVLEDLAAAAEAKRIDLGLDEADPEVHACGRRVALREIFMNLVDNAIRYTPAGGVVTVRVSRDGERATVVVEDDGPGIPEASRAFVFERFARLSDSDSDGCGLGLAVVRELAGGMDARVELATPEGGRGLAAIVRLKAAERPVPQPAVPAVPAAAGGAPHCHPPVAEKELP